MFDSLTAKGVARNISRSSKGARIGVRAWTFGGLSIALLSGVASAALAEPVAAPSSSSLPPVTLEAQRAALAEQAHEFVGKVSGSSWATAVDRPLELWRQPVCVAVAGLHPEAEFIFRRFTQIITEAGATVGRNGCTPNLIVVLTTEPEAFLRAWKKRDMRLFGSANPALVSQFLTRALPVRVWYNTSFAGKDASGGAPSSVLSSAAAAGAGPGGAITSTQTQFMLLDVPTFPEEAGGTRLSLTAVPDLSSAIVVVDLKQCEGIGWGALTDYIAMASLTNVDLDSNFGDTPSVLALFSGPADKRLAGMTDWDRAYLKAVYHSRRMARLQRVEIRAQMVREMDATMANTY